MAKQSVTINEIDGKLGNLPSGEAPIAIFGVATGGPVDTPTLITSTTEAANVFTSGPLVRMVSDYILRSGRPAVCTRLATATQGAYPGGTVLDEDNTAVPGQVTVKAAGVGERPDDDYELYVVITKSGTQGSSNIEYRTSRDGGRTLGPVTVESGGTIVVPNTGGCTFLLSALSTYTVGDNWLARAKAPQPDAAGVTAGTTAYKNTTFEKELALVECDGTAAIFDACATAFNGTEIYWLMRDAVRDYGVSVSSHFTAMEAIFSGKASTYCGICFDGCEYPSAAGPLFARSPMLPVAVELKRAGLGEDISAPIRGSLAGVSITENSTPKYYDENVHGVADDARYITLTTDDVLQGVYITNPNLFSPAGSDFKYLQHRRVMRAARRALNLYFKFRLSKDIFVNATTGFILESDAVEMENGATAALSAALGNWVSGVSVTLARNNNILASEPISVTSEIIPKAYPKSFVVNQSFSNPANVVAN